MNRLTWKIGESYLIGDIMSERKGVLEGFIINQCTINWKNQISYRNHPDNTVWFVLSFQNYNNEKRFAIATPKISSYIPDVTHGAEIYSEISLYGEEYGDSVEELILKLKENWVFTKELSYDAKYKEGYKQE